MAHRGAVVTPVETHHLLFDPALSLSPVKHLKVRIPGVDGCGFIVSLALWVWVGSGKGLLVEEAWLVRVPGDKGAVRPSTRGPSRVFVPQKGGLESG